PASSRMRPTISPPSAQSRIPSASVPLIGFPPCGQSDRTKLRIFPVNSKDYCSFLLAAKGLSECPNIHPDPHARDCDVTYSVKEIFKTLQGEGGQAGRAAVCCRFAGCNLWSGSEKDRSTAVCQFCDTDFVGTDGQGGGTFTAAVQLADAIARKWRADNEKLL